MGHQLPIKYVHVVFFLTRSFLISKFKLLKCLTLGLVAGENKYERGIIRTTTCKNYLFWPRHVIAVLQIWKRN